MKLSAVSPPRLMVALALYFVLLFGGASLAVIAKPELLPVLPIGGVDALDMAKPDITSKSDLDQLVSPNTDADRPPMTAEEVGLVVLFLSFSLSGTLLVMLPIAWTYAATRRDIGYRKNFLRALMVLPICGTTVVLLIQDSLALAFGLAAMVAAVRFRVALDEAIDGIYIFAAICISLAAGIGHLGVAAIMAVFFCFANAILWQARFGRNPIDEARLEKKRAKMPVTD